MIHSILVKDYMDHNPHAVSIDNSLTDVVKVFITDNIIGAPVVNANKEVVGYVSEQDCIGELLNDSYYLAEPPSVESAMTTDVKSVKSSDSIVEVAQSMITHRARNFPVIDNGKLVGLISRSRILEALVENRKDTYFHEGS
ncbi:MAG: CBS domain-containing protein [Cellvibrionaceae bacterium]